MDPVRIGVLGCAEFARRRMLPAFRACPDTELVAVASRDAAKARTVAAEAGCLPVTGYGALLERDDIDAVYVPLPAALHAPWVEAALRAGRHVLAEKPLTTDPVATRTLTALAGSAGLALRENVLFVHHPQHAEVLRLVADGAIGEPRSLHAAFTVPRLPDDDIRHDPALGGGALFDTGVYPVRAALHLLGGPLETAGAVLRRGGPGRAVDIGGTALLHTRDGVGAQLSFGLDHAYRSRYEFRGSEGCITVDRAFTPPADHRPRILLERRAGTEEIVLPADDQVARAVSAFAEAVRTGAATDPAVPWQAELLDGIRRRAVVV
ncbi:Gfo/Idh/MocA family oxidoreductase [Streptomyces sp. NPDC089799]|uniref:Gfo/Idh/MocA family protein n=1 Tax=Streptomyces sp. NPDC089799 TaxID=3155066 RepID=UPI0034475A31